MTPEEILTWCLEELPDTVLVESWGERGVFYNPGGRFKRGVYVLTVKEKDGANDKASRLCREGVFRVNLGVRRETFRRLFGPLPQRPPAGGVAALPVDYTALGRLLPHPVYAWMGWICCLCPTPGTFGTLKPLIREAYGLAVEKAARRKQ